MLDVLDCFFPDFEMYLHPLHILGLSYGRQRGRVFVVSDFVPDDVVEHALVADDASLKVFLTGRVRSESQSSFSRSKPRKPIRVALTAPSMDDGDVLVPLLVQSVLIHTLIARTLPRLNEPLELLEDHFGCGPG